jgi:hypothetical protein
MKLSHLVEGFHSGFFCYRYRVRILKKVRFETFLNFKRWFKVRTYPVYCLPICYFWIISFYRIDIKKLQWIHLCLGHPVTVRYLV